MSTLNTTTRTDAATLGVYLFPFSIHSLSIWIFIWRGVLFGDEKRGKKKKKNGEDETPISKEKSLPSLSNQGRLISISDIKTATRDFSESLVIGVGERKLTCFQS
ncbi:hypothetical protein QJS10_CPB21g01788 [Acorus calamus]|uniref:Transmembrane protein n=1 Tax=Acorus calamus TaxID=4465 RepID=A0AAV9C4Z8_ACOCL|nr:hypothetical protein QJS10_CPB21g01788 [Acorus calamus]